MARGRVGAGDGAGDAGAEPSQFGRLHLGALGQQIRTLREARRWSLNRLAEEAGLSVPAVRNIESGAAEPRLMTVLALAEALDEPIDRLIETARTASRGIRVTRAGSGGEAVVELTAAQPDMHLVGRLLRVGGEGAPAAAEAPAGMPVFMLVLEGTAIVEYADGARDRLARGDGIHFIEAEPPRIRSGGRGGLRLLQLADAARGAASSRTSERAAQ